MFMSLLIMNVQVFSMDMNERYLTSREAILHYNGKVQIKVPQGSATSHNGGPVIGCPLTRRDTRPVPYSPGFQRSGEGSRMRVLGRWTEIAATLAAPLVLSAPQQRSRSSRIMYVSCRSGSGGAPMGNVSVTRPVVSCSNPSRPATSCS